MKKISLLLLTTFLSSAIAYNQKATDETYKEIFLDGEFFLYAEEYLDALPFYRRIYNRGYQDNANINYRIGICYLKIPGQKNESIQYLEKASEKASSNYKEGVFKQDLAPLDVYAYLGNAYRINNKLDEAITAYQKYKSGLDVKKLDERTFADKQIAACMVAKQMTKSPILVEFKNAGQTINSSSSNYNAVISGDGKSMVYMFELPFYEAVYYLTKTNGEWGKPRNITPEIVSDGNMFTRSLSYDGKILLLTKEDAFNSDIWISELNAQGRWVPAQPISKNINSKYWESHASLSPDGKKLFFASNRKDGFGEMDIYVSEKGESDWNEPANIGNVINSDLNEDSPLLTADGKYLFFSSQGHKCMGGYDIFYSELKNDGNWSEPVNIGYPLNTTDDELFYCPLDINNGYMARLANGGYGKEDIYMVNVQLKPVEGASAVMAEKEEEKAEETMAMAEVAVEGTGPTMPDDAEEMVEETNAIAEKIAPPEEKPGEKDGKVVIEDDKEIVDMPDIKEEVAIEKPVQRNLSIKPILFDFNSSSVSGGEVKKMRELVETLKENPAIKIELTGYTDALGTDEINRIISQRRSDNIKGYLVKNGVDAARIKSVGKGEQNFIALNTNPNGTDNPKGRYYNRRVEIALINAGDNIKLNYINPVPEELRAK